MSRSSAPVEAESGKLGREEYAVENMSDPHVARLVAEDLMDSLDTLPIDISTPGGDRLESHVRILPSSDGRTSFLTISRGYVFEGEFRTRSTSVVASRGNRVTAFDISGIEVNPMPQIGDTRPMFASLGTLFDRYRQSLVNAIGQLSPE